MTIEDEKFVKYCRLKGRLTRQEQRKLERILLTPDQNLEMAAFDKAVTRSNRQFYEFHDICEPRIIDQRAFDNQLYDNYDEESFP